MMEAIQPSGGATYNKYPPGHVVCTPSSRQLKMPQWRMIKRPVFPGILPGKAGRAFSGIVQCCKNVCTLQSECWFRLCTVLIFREKLQPSNARRMIQRMHYPSSYSSANGFLEAAIFQVDYDTTCECIETLDLNGLQRLALLEVCLMWRTPSQIISG